MPLYERCELLVYPRILVLLVGLVAAGPISQLMLTIMRSRGLPNTSITI